MTNRGSFDIGYLGSLDHKASRKQLKMIFNKNIARSIFISIYPHFGIDGNEQFYIDFIDSNIFRSKFKAQEDALELSIKINTFKNEYINAVRQIIYSRRPPWMKLLALDWLFNFFQNIQRDVFFEINKYSKENNRQNILLQVQSYLNLLLLGDGDEIIDDLLKALSLSDDPAVFYRVLYGLNRTYLLVEETSGYILSIIKNNNYLSKNQKHELNYLIYENIRIG
ncbi:hypothetical protein [Pararcticibacter amylolyticus]|uniref:Uncharacterized protein n=1 Tax=Pararcticibacter amylolyticus TaxID=2173175 RepID=A0A2U2PL42_9SPHI|nr:hypothetical protein [Pararcticibacter amylolyticus]PWG82121.1 hypothetical protein DDR33_03645 [Pararcticibacter amylolyticus]